MAQRTSPTGVGPTTAAADAARVVLRQRLEVLRRQVRRVRKEADNRADAARDVHQMRVACRRAAAAVEAFEPCIDTEFARKLRKLLRRARRAAGAQRDLDILADLLREWEKNGPAALRAAHRRLLTALRTQSTAARERLDEVLSDKTERLLARSIGKLEQSPGDDRRDAPISGSGDGAASFGVLARRQAHAAAVRVERSAAADLTLDEHVHELRVAIKRLRYVLEVFAPCFDARFWRETAAGVAHVQEVMGAFNDQSALTAMVRAEPHAGSKALATQLVKAHERVLAEHRIKAVEAWLSLRNSPVWLHLRQWAAPHPSTDPHARAATKGHAPGAIIEGKPRHAPALAPSLNGAPSRPISKRATTKHRLAAIDVGSNSLRLIIAEASPDGSYRVLDDEKETTRLGRGLEATGRMSPDAIVHSAVAVQRMASIAQGYGAAEIRVVATAAAREATNAAALAKAIRQRAGLDMHVISAEEEARYAYRSAAKAFDCSAAPAVVVDIGGGSTEVVLSVGRSSTARPAGGGGAGAATETSTHGAGVIERVYTIPMGAVRLTEKFGGDPDAFGPRFDELRRFVRRLVKEHVGRPPVVPQLFIGTGGTLTSLGAIVAQRDLGRGADGLFGGSVQGMLVMRSDVKHLIERLRKLPLKQRMRVPGLSAERADIIVSGFVMIDALLKRFACNTLRVHEGGIRDGLLLSMVDERFGRTGASSAAQWSPDAVLKVVRKFARACSYERAHSEHVASLALSIFDQLREAGGKLGQCAHELGSRERVLLEAAAVLHDIGYLINYAQHHKHSYHLIVHADLPGLTTREVRIVASVARYHRAAGPKVKHHNYRTLEPRDQRVVELLSGILRIADGLDRTHTQCVRSVSLRPGTRDLLVHVESESEPAVDMWGAQRKSDVFARAFERGTRFDWARAAPSGARALATSGPQQR